MKKIILLLSLFSTILSAQNIFIQVNGFENWQASLYSISLEKINYVESITSDNKGLFKFSNKNLHHGFYRIVFGNKIWLNFVYDSRAIKIKTNKNNLFNVQILKSDANKEYYKYLKLAASYNIEQKQLQKANKKYSGNDKKLIFAKKDFSNIYKKYWAFINKVTNSNDRTLISRYIKSAHQPYVKPELNKQEKKRFIIEHFWDNVDFSSAELLRSDIYANKTIEYLNYVTNSKQTKEVLEKEYQNAVEIILNKAKVNLRIYKQLTQYLIKGFKKLDFGNVIDYIVNNFVVRDDLCLDSKTENLIKMRIDQSKIFKVNVKVPNIKLPDTKGNKMELYNVDADKVLILFYSSYCPHCKIFLPKLLKLYSKKSFYKFEIYGISLDTDLNKWRSFVKNNNYNWTNVSDLQGWKSKVSYDFYIYATPTMFLVDKNFKIIGKPKNLKELKTDLLNN